MFDRGDDPLGFVGTTMRDQPARAFRNRIAKTQDEKSEQRADAKAHAPADIGREMRGVEHHERRTRAERSAEPERAVDQKRDAAAVARRDQLVDHRIDRRVLAADAAAGQEAKHAEARKVPRKCAEPHAGEIYRKRDEKKSLTPVSIGEPSENE